MTMPADNMPRLRARLWSEFDGAEEGVREEFVLAAHQILDNKSKTVSIDAHTARIMAMATVLELHAWTMNEMNTKGDA